MARRIPDGQVLPLFLALRERDGDICGICMDSIDFSITDRNDAMAWTFDHIGDRTDHSLENLRLAHRRCNTVRYNRAANRGAPPPNSNGLDNASAEARRQAVAAAMALTDILNERGKLGGGTPKVHKYTHAESNEPTRRSPEKNHSDQMFRLFLREALRWLHEQGGEADFFDTAGAATNRVLKATGTVIKYATAISYLRQLARPEGYFERTGDDGIRMTSEGADYLNGTPGRMRPPKLVREASANGTPGAGNGNGSHP